MKIKARKIDATMLATLSCAKLDVYKDAKRQLRAPLMKAFDVYKSNVNYGLVEETEKEKAEILAWYEDLLNLKERALKTVPEKIKYYL